MKIQEISINIKEKYFLKYNGLNDKDYKKILERDRGLFLKESSNKIEIIENREISGVDSDGRINGCSKAYSGYFIKYYEGILTIKGEQSKSNVFMKVSLNNSIMNLVLKEAGGEIKELVKKEYEEFEQSLLDLINKTKNKNIFGNFVVSKFKTLREAILKNTNKTL